LAGFATLPAGLAERINCISANLLEQWPVGGSAYNLVIMSNIIHVYSEAEITFLLSQATRCLSEQGYLLIHDFFLQHSPVKAALFDLNMFIHTYNGKVISGKNQSHSYRATDRQG
jgi:hypothetical protein